jgi:hypothetical protein
MEGRSEVTNWEARKEGCSNKSPSVLSLDPLTVQSTVLYSGSVAQKAGSKEIK